MNDNYSNDETSISDLLLKLKSSLTYIFKHNLLLLISSIIVGGISGLGISILKPTTYQSEMSFMVEEGRTTSSLAAVAGQLGFDISGNSNTTLFSGDNILMFLKSKNLSKETLLTEYSNNNNVKLLLADKYSEVYGLKKKWIKNNIITDKFNFSERFLLNSNRLLIDSLLQIMTNRILKTELIVERPEKKATVIKVSCEMRDELLAKLFCERLVKIATEKYVQSKTTRQRRNVDKLERRSDSLKNILNGRTFLTAIEQEKVIDVNPANKTATIEVEMSNRDKLMLTQLYGEVVKNLELGKVQLNQETPTIQAIDMPELPLLKSKKTKVLFSVIGAFLGAVITIFILFVFRKMKSSNAHT